MSLAQTDSVSTLAAHLREAIVRADGWIGFDRYMALALYAPGLGYYAAASRPFGALPSSGSDFITAPELTPLFGLVLARQVEQALDASGTREVVEFGAGSGALAEQLLDTLDAGRVERYAIVEVSAALHARQSERLARFGERVRWLDALPQSLHGVVLGNEVLDSMPVQLLHWDGERWHERGVALDANGALAFSDRPTRLRPPVEAAFVPGTTVELHAQGEAFVATVAERLARGAAFFIDYGFPAAEYYHPQRVGGTVMCHSKHRADTDPLIDAGAKDITAHVDFSGIALAAQDAGLEVVGYTSQARFLFNCGLAGLLEGAAPRDVAAAQKLLGEHEMGELFKVIAFATRGFDFEPIGFVEGDRTHRL